MTHIAGIAVVNVGNAMLCTSLLSAMGARIVSLDAPSRERGFATSTRAHRYHARLRRLLGAADILIDGLSQSEDDRNSIRRCDLGALNPKLVHCTIDLGNAAPLDPTFSVPAQLAELYAHQQILLLLLDRHRRGRGCHLTVKVHGALAKTMRPAFPIAWLATILNMDSIRGRHLDMRILSASDGIVIVPSDAAEALHSRGGGRCNCSKTTMAASGTAASDKDWRDLEQIFVQTPVGDATRQLDLASIPSWGISHTISETLADVAAPVRTELNTASHAAARWARVVVRAVDSPADPKTIAAWGREVAAAPGTIKNWCRTAGLPARNSLAFARVLRAILRHQSSGGRPEDLLDVVDRRTLAQLLRLGAGAHAASEMPITVQEFLRRQRWIRDPVALREIEVELNQKGATTLSPESRQAS